MASGRFFLSMEERRDGAGRPFDQFYTLTPTHLWLYDLERKSLTEIATKERNEVFYTPQLLVSDTRMLVQVPRSKLGQVLSMNLDGSDARAFTKPDEGLPYGFSVSPDHRRVAFHLASPQGYQIWTTDAEGGNRTLVAAHPDHLYFGPSWSPDGSWLMFQDCLFKDDPGQEASDICVARPDGTELKVLTRGQAQWFGATYGNPTHRGSGSNMPAWTRDGQILFSRRTPDAQSAWQYPAVWDFRASESPDGKRVAFCRCAVGETPAIWVMNAMGGEEKMLTRGLEGNGADQPRWLPISS